MLKIKKNKKTKFWKECVASGSHTLLAGMQTGMAILESSLAASYKDKDAFNIQLSYFTPRRNKNICLHKKKLYLNGLRSFIHNKIKLKKIPRPMNW